MRGGKPWYERREGGPRMRGWRELGPPFSHTRTSLPSYLYPLVPRPPQGPPSLQTKTMRGGREVLE